MRTLEISRAALTTGFLILAMGVLGVSEAGETPAMTLDGPIMFSASGEMVGEGLVFLAVEDTGGQGCWDAEGVAIPCSGTGQDGELQAGADLPTPRFTPTGDGTVVDNLTGLVWLQDANCFGSRLWIEALSYANGLMEGQCDLTDGSLAMDWRLPNVKELLSLIDYGEIEPAVTAGHPFFNLQDAWYWSSTSSAEEPENAWGVGLDSGNNDHSPKTSSNQFVLPVRGGQ